MYYLEEVYSIDIYISPSVYLNIDMQMSCIIDKRKLIRILFIFLFFLCSVLFAPIWQQRWRRRRRLLSRPWPLFLFSMQQRRQRTCALSHSLVLLQPLLLHCLLCCLHIYCVVCCCCYWFYNLICLLTRNTAIDLHFWLLTAVTRIQCACAGE